MESVARPVSNINIIQNTLAKSDAEMCIKKKRAYVFLVLLYKALLDILYVTGIAKDYAYYGLDFAYTPEKIVIGYAFFLVILIFIIKHMSHWRPSNLLMFFFEIMYFIPGTTFHTYSSSEISFLWFFIGFYLLFQLANELAKKAVKEKHKPSSPETMANKRAAYKVFIYALLAFTVFYLVYYNGFKIKLDFSNVYQIRAQIGSSDIPTVISYIKNPTGILIPILIYVCLKDKKFVKAFLLIVLQLAMYAFGANKIHLLSIGVSIAMALINRRQIYLWVLVGLSLFLVFSVIYRSAMGELDVLSNVLIRRTMFTPHKMCHDYFTCFSTREPDYWRASILRYFGFQSPYGELTYYIGIYNKTFSNCDNGLAGDAFGNFGYYSLLIYPFLYFLVFVSYNFMCRGMRKEIIIFLSFIYAVVFYDAPFFTVMMTHGYLFMFLFFITIFPYKYSYKFVKTNKKQNSNENLNQVNC